MAGLYSNIITKKSMPQWPAPDRTIGVYAGSGNNKSGSVYLPGFAGGTARRSILVRMRNDTTNIYQYDPNLTAITDGVWNGGMTIDEASGTSDTANWLQWYMDEADNKLYILTEATGTNPWTVYLSSVNEAGTVTAIGNAQYPHQHMAASDIFGTIAGPMHRTGGDGSGNLQYPITYSAGAGLGAATPYRGTMLTINITNGSLSSSALFPSTYSANQQNVVYGAFGVTANNILLTQNSAWEVTNPQAGVRGSIYNLTTGESIAGALIMPVSGATSIWNPSSYVIRWRGRYFFGAYAELYGRTGSGYAEADVHNWVDEMAVYYGIL